MALREITPQLPKTWNSECNYHHPLTRDKTAAHPSLTLQDVILKERIGSNSSVGIVYRAESTDGTMAVAVKFTPFLGGNENPEKEMEIAHYLGKLAKENPDLPFPITFGYGNTAINLPDNYGQRERANKENIRRSMIKQGFSRGQAMRAAHQNRLPENFNRPTTNFSLWLISELAIGDLTQVPKPIKYKKDSLCALEALHKAGYCHGDVHLGNFLLLKGGMVIIHDFGNSEPFTQIGKQRDLDRFAEAWNKVNSSQILVDFVNLKI